MYDLNTGVMNCFRGATKHWNMFHQWHHINVTSISWWCCSDVYMVSFQCCVDAGFRNRKWTVLLIFEARGRDKMGMWDVWCVLDLLIRGYNDNFGWSELLLHKSYVVNSHQNLLTEAVLMKGPQHVMIYVYGEIRRYQNHQRIIPLFRGQRAVLQTIRGNRNNFEIIFHTYKHILWALFTTVSVRRF